MSDIFMKGEGKLASFANRLGIRTAPDLFLAEALSELDENRADKPLWAKALSKTSGNQDKARALYIRMRGQFLADKAKENQTASERSLAAKTLSDNLNKRIINLSDQIDAYERAICQIRARLAGMEDEETHPSIFVNELRDRKKFLLRLREMREDAEAELSRCTQKS